MTVHSHKLILAKIWCLATVTALTTGMWLPMVTKSGQPLNEPITLIGCGMAVIMYYVYSKYGAVK